MSLQVIHLCEPNALFIFYKIYAFAILYVSILPACYKNHLRVFIIQEKQ